MKIFVKVKPKAKAEKVIRKTDGSFEVWVKAPSIEGRANKAAARTLAEFLGVAPSAVRLVAGAKSKTKIFGKPLARMRKNA